MDVSASHALGRRVVHSRFGPNRELVLLELGESRVREEDLEEAPDVLRRRLRRADARRPMREANANGLVDEEPSARTRHQHTLNNSERGIQTYTFETSFHAYGFSVTPLLSFVMRQGPSSWNRPIILELPGCP